MPSILDKVGPDCVEIFETAGSNRKFQVTMMDRDHVSSVDYTFATLYKMAGKTLKLVFQQSMELPGFLALEQLGRSRTSFNVRNTSTNQHGFVTCRGRHWDNLGFGSRVSQAGADKTATAAAGV